MKNLFYITLLFAGAILASCISDNDTPCLTNNVEVSFSVIDFTPVNKGTVRATTRATETASSEEKAVKNIGVFLFKEDGTSPITYFSGNTGGAWSAADKKVTINQLQSTVGKRLVYVVANYDAVLKTALSNVTTVADLKNVLRTADPFTLGSDIAANGLLMEGHTATAHDFMVNYQLIDVPLVRAMAKLELNFTLKSPEHQSATLTDYGYKYLNFGKNTYVLPDNATQTGNVESHTAWQNIPGIAVAASGKVETFALTAYINEYKTGDPVAGIEIKLPYNVTGGFLPPPEFGDGDIYRLKLPVMAERNHLYRYNLEIEK